MLAAKTTLVLKSFRRSGMSRGLAALVVGLPFLLAPTPAAHAVGVGGCTISGKIRFTPSAAAADRGMWDISPAVIQCHGMFNFVSSPRGGRRGVGEKFSGKQQPFSGSGSYKTIPSGDRGCLQELGEGTVAYLMTTENQDMHVVEPTTFLLAGAGTFVTPQLRGSFQIPLHDNECLSEPVTTALFTAEVAWLRTSGVWK